jgi:hypothetical protein
MAGHEDPMSARFERKSSWRCTSVTKSSVEVRPTSEVLG